MKTRKYIGRALVAAVALLTSAMSPAYSADYYNIPAPTLAEKAGASSISGISGEEPSTGWSTTQGGSRAIAGITAADSVYHVYSDFVCRSSTSSYATPASSSIKVEAGVSWMIFGKQSGNTTTLNNLTLSENSKLHYFNNGDGGIGTLAGSFTMAEGSCLKLSGRYYNNERSMNLSATVTGSGSIEFFRYDNNNAYYANQIVHSVTGDISAFTGDLVVYDYNDISTLVLELPNASSLPGDPAAEEVSYVVVTNGATIQVDNDWVSPTNRIWILGDSGTPTINVPSGVTLTIAGDLVGTVGFNKTGKGTLVLKGASDGFAGKITISAGEVRFSGKAAALSTDADITWTEDGGTLVVASLSLSEIPDQTVYDIAVLDAGIEPSVTVSNLEESVELVLGTDYTVSYSDNTTYGVATATVTGTNDYAGASISKTFIIHAIKEVASSFALSGNEDWTAFESVSLASGVVIDLNGHNLTISGLDGAGEITDSIGGGSLIFDVPAVFTSGYEAKIENVSLTGKLKLVKTGAGLLKAAKTGQTYTGGNDILGGVLRVDVGAGSAMNGACPLGSNSSSAHNSVYLGPNGTLDPAGTQGWGHHDFVIAGGMVSNTVASTSTTYGVFNPEITFTADSTIATSQEYGWTIRELGGHTITVDIAIGKTLYVATFTADPLTETGRLDIVRGGYLATFSNRNANFKSIDLDEGRVALSLNGDMSIHDYRPTYSGDYGLGSAALNVYGTFTPDSDYFYGPTMQDGSAIDLSEETSLWSVKSSLSKGGNPTTKFASGATVAILLGERTPAIGERLVSWTSSTAPDSTVAFTNDTYVLRAESNGLFVDSLRTFAATHIPDLASATSVAEVEAVIASSLAVSNFVSGTGLVLGTDYSYDYVIDGATCTVTITGLVDYDGKSLTRTFSLGQILVKSSYFAYTMEITPSVGKVTTTLADFPVLVRLSESAIPGFKYSTCNSDGLRFALPDGTLLAHEVDYWNAGGESTVWVNIPELTSNTVFYAHWGLLPGREALSPSTGDTWPGYVGVWHLSEDGGTAADSTANGLDMAICAQSSNPTASIEDPACVAETGKVGRGRYIPKTSALFHANESSMNVGSTYTISGWFCQTNSAASWFRIASKRGQYNHTEGGWYFCHCVANNSMRCEYYTANTSRYGYTHTPDKSVSVGTWYYFHAVQSGSSAKIYLNGELSNSGSSPATTDSTYALVFGMDSFMGVLDEMRYSRKALSAEAIAADYATQTDADFLTYGKVESRTGFLLIVR